MKVDIGVIGAMEPEVEALIAALEGCTCESVSGIDFYIGSIGEKRVAIARCGIGKVFAAMCAQTMILKYSPDLIVNTGVGGALASGLTTGISLSRAIFASTIWIPRRSVTPRGLFRELT